VLVNCEMMLERHFSALIIQLPADKTVCVILTMKGSGRVRRALMMLFL
jgi:hypothetical protein